ncbi:MAG: SAM-dependent methyltransferase [Clostridia bacterium]|nr:SAM-dependent methyltransferase [Clostridia bacterium]
MTHLDKRLSAVAALIRPGSRLADIGTDHAYLPVYLVEQEICPCAIASDIGAGPLEAARRTVEAAGLSGEISCRLGNGLATVSADEVEDIAIAGMGGETIAAILEAAPWVKDARLRLVLQPMTHAEDLRRWLLRSGFSVLEEHLIRDKRHQYPVMAAEYTATPVEDELACYAGFFEAEEGRPYRQHMAEHLRRRAAGLSRAANTVETARLVELAELLRKM